MREIIESQAIAEGFTHVRKVILEIGELSHVESEAMRFCFESVMKGSCGENATLEITSMPGLATCRQCGMLSQIENLYDPCEHCGAFGLQVTSGDQVRIKSLEVA